MLWCSMRFEDEHAEMGERSESPFDTPSDFVPLKTTETSSERGQGY